MKNIRKISIIFFAVTGLISCVEEDPIFNLEDSPNVIEIKNTGATSSPISDADAIYPIFSNAFDILPEVDLPITISYSGASVAPADITVTLGVNESAISKYNEWWNADDDPEDLHDDEDQYDLMPSSLYSFPSNTVVIPKGKREATFIIKVRTNQFDFTKNYGLPLTITNVSQGVISGNYGNAIISVGAKNKYDGVYRLVGRLSSVPDRPTLNTSTEFTWPGDGAIELRSSGANTVDLYDTYYNWGGGLSQWTTPIGTPSGFSAFGSARPRFTIDPATNKVTAVTNMFPNPSNRRAFAIDPTYDSKYDPTTKVLDVRFIMTQPGFAPLPITYKLTFKEAR